MIETILFLGGLFTTWTLLGLVCAERYRRLRKIEDEIETERAAEAVRAAEAADAARRKGWTPANAASAPKPDIAPVQSVATAQTPTTETGRAAA